ncbi:MAG: hypothetical protein CMQ49_06490 [Gammaproteobacteria bacterium]|nr:hypothetical protein [Gammaproteobacteria bacterium]
MKGWIVRDLVITCIVTTLLWTIHAWHSGSGVWIAALASCLLGFLGGYVLCYVYHEWGHLIGARLAGGQMPLAPYAGPIIGLFDLNRHSRRQFLFLSWGGVLAYVSIMVITLVTHFAGLWGLAGAAFAVGGLAFVAQSLSVDLPQIVKVMRGANIQATSAAGANAQVILRRTWQSWIPLALAIAAYNTASA